jgi:transposase-like protein
MKYRVNRITDELALKMVTEYLETDKSLKEMQKKYKIKSDGTIYYWMRKLGLTYPDDQELKTREIMKEEQNKSHREKELEKEVEKLRKELEYQALKSRAYKKMIEIAERNYSITIRKKFGPKQ